jgi:hypothetical protein
MAGKGQKCPKTRQKILESGKTNYLCSQIVDISYDNL